jgi:NTP pyrophosphatase (non-canonical NTP hydrolase)
MTGNEYQAQAARTINLQLNDYETQMHSLHGMAAELGEIHALFQKKFQGHEVDEEKLKEEAGDLIWNFCEFLTSRGLQLDDVMESNIEKLRKRYPDGFSEWRSKHRGG